MRFSKTRRTAVSVMASGVFVIAACAGDTSRGGALVISAAGDADSFFPPTERNAQSREVSDLLFDRLAEIGPELSSLGDAGWVPRLAERWDWAPDSMSVTFHLNPKARWHDSTPVQASDVRYAFQVYTDPKVGASGGSDIAAVVDSMSVRDSVTCTAWFKVRSPERFYALTLNLVPLPSHLLSAIPHDSLATSAFSRQPVGNGPYRFVHHDDNQRIEIAAVADHYRGRPGPDRVIWTIVPQNQAASLRVLAGDADFIETLTLGEVAEVAKHPELQAIRLRGSQLSFLVFNMFDGASNKPHAILGDRAMRRALTAALDRQSMVHNVLDSLGRVPLGPFSRIQWTADSTLRQINFDPAAAAHTLDSLGWHTDADGMRSREGKPLAFSLLVPESSSQKQQFAVLMQEELRKVGVRVNVEVMEFRALVGRLRKHDFDAVFMATGASPSPAGVHQTWSTAAITQSNGLNFGRYSGKLADAQIDSAMVATTEGEGRKHYRAAYQALLDDAPGVWVYEPIIMMAANRRIKVAPMRDDAWWESIPAWRLATR